MNNVDRIRQWFCDRMIRRLRFYYESKGISANRFNCVHCKECKGGNPDFVGPTEPTIGADYIKNKLPRVLFVSLDPGSADKDPYKRALTVIDNIEVVGDDPLSLPKGDHWQETHILAWMLLRRFRPSLQFKKVGSYFAHTNSAKCCQNNKGNAMASITMFNNCRKFLPKEIEILSPDILVTQGRMAQAVVESGIYNGEQDCYGSAERLETCVDECYVYLITVGEMEIIWLNTYHPHTRPPNLYQYQKAAHFEVWADVVYKHLSYHGWGND